MLRTTLKRAVIRPLSTTTTRIICRRQSGHAVNIAAEPSTKREGDISDSFASLSRLENAPLPDQFRVLKASLVDGHEEAIKASWDRLLERLKIENEVVAQQGSKVIPEIRFDHLDEDLRNSREEIKKRGAAVIRGVVPEDEARGYKFELDDYIRKNPQTKGFPNDDPQVWELYWSAPQLRARLHPNFLRVQSALMRHTWHTSDPTSLVSLTHPLTYADRLRMRQPGDAAFSLGPHQDGGSVERWMREGYGRGGTYNAVFAGKWDADEFDPWDASTRVDAVNDLYDGLGACSAFRMFQGWLSMSAVGPREGTLLVNPLLKLATAYSLLRPFFRPRMTLPAEQQEQPLQGVERARFLDARNWEFTGGDSMTSEIPGATPGYGMEFPRWAWHPHLELDRTMVHVPAVRPGDFVAWHCDTTELNANYVARMRQAWRNGTPGPDFPGGKGESEHVDRPDEQFVRSVTNADGLASMGLEPLREPIDGSEGEKEAVRRANRILGF
ncbi:hypothetical protein N0V82_009553 [Gnomoniopsis sp. IMI 355080]|nr:hypothetical protein N0V82_009553 [Gnomoniopsis sp. IMI 355080]